MKKSQLVLFVILICSLFPKVTFAQEADDADKSDLKDSMEIKVPIMPTHKFYVSSATDMAVFSTAGVTNVTANQTLKYTGTLRFTYFLNFGFTFNYDFNKHIGIYTGIDIKNIGYIDNRNGETIKRRTYNVGVPLALKIGNIKDKNYVFFGGGLDVPINFKQKVFVERNHKSKYNEWFSDATPHVMPYVFVGYCMKPGITYKLQYYPNNFLNEDYQKDGTKPFTGTTVHLLLFSIGFNVPYSKSPTYDRKTIDPKHFM